MKKLYIDLAIAIFCIWMMVKYTLAFVIIIGILAVIWFFVLDASKKEQIKKKIDTFLNDKN